MTEHEKMLQMIEEYQRSGGSDLNSFHTHISALAADGATPFLKLNQWKSSDKPVMEDFNDDNQKIDAAVHELWERKADLDSPALIGTPTINNLPIATVKSPTWTTVSVTEHYTGVNGPYCCKTGAGIVFVRGVVSRQTVPETGETIATLPAGYRPAYTHPIQITSSRGSSGTWATYGYITPGGAIQFHTGPMPSGWINGAYLAFSTCFPG